MAFQLDEIENILFSLIDDIIREANRAGPNVLLIVGKLQMYKEIYDGLLGGDL